MRFWGHCIVTYFCLNVKKLKGRELNNVRHRFEHVACNYMLHLLQFYFFSPCNISLQFYSILLSPHLKVFVPLLYLFLIAPTIFLPFPLCLSLLCLSPSFLSTPLTLVSLSVYHLLFIAYETHKSLTDLLCLIIKQLTSVCVCRERRIKPEKWGGRKILRLNNHNKW